MDLDQAKRSCLLEACERQDARHLSTILGTGEVALILDVAQMVQLAIAGLPSLTEHPLESVSWRN